MLRGSRSLFLGIFLIVGGCNLFNSLNNPPPEVTGSGSSSLKAFTSATEMRDYLTGQISQRNGTIGAPPNEGNASADSGSPPSAPSGSAEGAAPAMDSASGGGGGFSGTTIQEAGVDESDVVKTDGTNIYVISNKNDASVMRVVQTSPLQLLSETKLEGYGSEIYLHGSKVVAITSGGGIYFGLFEGGGIADAPVVAVSRQTAVNTSASEPVATDTSAGGVTVDPIGGIAPAPFVYQRPYTAITVIDVTNAASPTILSTTKFDGSQAASRMIDGVLHLVLANYQDYYYDVMPMLGRPELDVAAVPAETLLPTYTRTDADGSESKGSVLNWDQLYRPTEPDGFGVVSLVSLDVDNDAKFSAIGVVSEPGLVYSSTDALYLTNTQWDFQGNSRTTTNIYKFAYADRKILPSATGSVSGRVLNQYSMGEKDGKLRVATTIDPRWQCGDIDCTQVEQAHNSVYVLGESQGTLSAIGKIENIAPGESIQAARFIGDRGFVVTFLQIDPLFTLDLSDPTNPKTVGKLEVPGYSTFLAPMDENHLLALGQYIPPPPQVGAWGVQLSVFDITDFANPVQTSNVVLGADTGAYSEALWNPKALTYFAAQGRVALPISIYAPVNLPPDGGIVPPDGTVPPVDSKPPADTTVVDGSTGSSGSATGVGTVTSDIYDPFAGGGFDGLIVFDATVDKGVSELGRLDTRFEDAGYWYPSFTRGVFVSADVHAVTDLGVHTASAADMSTAKAKLFFGLPFDMTEPPVLIDPIPIDGGTVPGDAGSAGSGSSPSTGSGGTPTPSGQ